MALNQEGDVHLFQTNDDGDINVVEGLVEMGGGLETAAYLSMFGGNIDDDVRDGNDLNWWGNLDENRESYQYRSETQNLTESIPATPVNLNRIEEAVKRDLQWFVTDNVATSVDVIVSLPRLNTVKIEISINAVGEASEFTFIENWKVDSAS
jgi:phage gp46-like protein